MTVAIGVCRAEREQLCEGSGGLSFFGTACSAGMKIPARDHEEERIMKKIALAVCLALLGATTAFAEEAKIGGMTLDELKKALGLSIYLQGGYTYNGSAGTVNGQQEENDLRVFDHKANSFTLDLAQIVFAKDAAVNTAGYKLKISAGETAKWIHSRGLSGADLALPQAGEG